jgi:hypothetical protein
MELMSHIEKGCQLRVKPEEEKWIVYLARYQDGLTLCCCDESYWETAKKFDGAKKKLFVGSEVEVKEWCNSRQKFTEIIEAWEDGKTIQFRHSDAEAWADCCQAPFWNSNTEYRVKPEEKTVVAKRCSGCVHARCSATKEPCVSCKPGNSKYEANDKDKMNPIQEKKMRRYNLNLGDWDELKEMAVKMFKEMAALNERFAEKISEGGFITQDDWKTMNGLWRTFNYTNDDNQLCKEDLHHLFTEDDLDEEFVEIKAECPCEDGIDSKACAGCEHSEDGKRKFGQIEYYSLPKKRCESDKKWKPYETVDEFVQDFQERFPTAVPRPAHSMPLIWVRNKNKKDETELIYCFRYLVIKMDNTYWDMDELFNQWEYLDGSPIGKEE